MADADTPHLLRLAERIPVFPLNRFPSLFLQLNNLLFKRFPSTSRSG